MNIIYTAVFFEDITNGTLEKPIQFPHVTHEFRPTQPRTDLFGERVTFTVVGYANNGINEGYLVELKDCSNAIREVFKLVELPHITLSVSREGKPMNTKFLDFQPCEPFDVVGVYGGFNGEGIAM